MAGVAVSVASELEWGCNPQHAPPTTQQGRACGDGPVHLELLATVPHWSPKIVASGAGHPP